MSLIKDHPQCTVPNCPYGLCKPYLVHKDSGKFAVRYYPVCDQHYFELKKRMPDAETWQKFRLILKRASKG